MSSDYPLVSLVMIAYNQERYVREAVEGAFAQTFEPLEIVLSDDCSNDRTFELMQELAAGYRGPHQVVLNRNQTNLGICGHLNRVMEIARGELIVGAAGDDISLPHRTATTHAAWQACGRPDYLFFGLESFSSPPGLEKVFRFHPETTTPPGMIKAGGMTLVAPAEAWHRRVFDEFGPLPDYVMTEDKSIAFRAALLGGVVYVSLELVRYRIHGDNISLRKVRGRRGVRAARVYDLSKRAARNRGFAHDIRTAARRGLLPAGQAEPLMQAVEAMQRLLDCRLRCARGGFFERIRGGIELGRLETRDGKGSARQRLGAMLRALRLG